MRTAFWNCLNIAFKNVYVFLCHSKCVLRDKKKVLRVSISRLKVYMLLFVTQNVFERWEEKYRGLNFAFEGVYASICHSKCVWAMRTKVPSPFTYRSILRHSLNLHWCFFNSITGKLRLLFSTYNTNLTLRTPFAYCLVKKKLTLSLKKNLCHLYYVVKVSK